MQKSVAALNTSAQRMHLCCSSGDGDGAQKEGEAAAPPVKKPRGKKKEEVPRKLFMFRLPCTSHHMRVHAACLPHSKSAHTKSAIQMWTIFALYQHDMDHTFKQLAYLEIQSVHLLLLRLLNASGVVWNASMRPGPPPSDKPVTKIMSWNVAGLRAVLKKVSSILGSARFDRLKRKS